MKNLNSVIVNKSFLIPNKNPTEVIHLPCGEVKVNGEHYSMTFLKDSAVIPYLMSEDKASVARVIKEIETQINEAINAESAK